MPCSPARAAAFDILLRVSEQDAFASELLHSELLAPLSPQDRALSTELVMGTLRWQSKLDADITPHSAQRLTKLDPEVLVALRLGAYQIGHLDRVPPRAAVNESVELVKRARKRSAAPFVNAVLRKLADRRADNVTAPPQGASAKELAAFYAHPSWLLERWISEFGPAATERICAYDQQTPVAAIRFAGPTGEITRELEADGIQLSPGALLTSARRVVAGDLTHTRAFTEGRVVIQDEASQLVALLVGKGQRFLDCCAAPGSKTALLAARNPDAQIVAAEIHPHRATLLRERVPNANVEVLTASAIALPYGAEFDRVLADVPCSGTGTLARNPEIKWKLRVEDLANLHARQSEILRAALRHLVPGGRLVYSTCSLETEENQSVVEEVLRDTPGIRLTDIAAEVEKLVASGELSPQDRAPLVRGGYLRTLPGRHSCEGFFAAILQRD